MKIEECIAKLEKYFASSYSTPRFVNVENRKDLKEIVDIFKMASYLIKTPADYSVSDNDPSVEKLTAGLILAHQPIILVGFSTQMKLKGARALEGFISTMAHQNSGKIAIICFQCSAQLSFSDPRLRQLVYSVDGIQDSKPKLILVNKETAPGNPYSEGIEKAGYLLETLNHPEIRISTHKNAAEYPNSLYSITELKDSFDALCAEDTVTLSLHREWGTKEQWNIALQKVSEYHSWTNWLTASFGTSPMSIIAGSWNGISDNLRWLFYIGLKLNGAPECRCLDIAAKQAKSYSELLGCIYSSILDISWKDPEFRQDYEQRKSLLRSMGCSDAIAKDYLNQAKRHEKNAIRYMTDSTHVEREAILNTISVYSEQYTQSELNLILEVVYPDLAEYLAPYSFSGNEWITPYIQEYRFCKVQNRISSAMMEMMKNEASVRNYNQLMPRMGVFSLIPKANAFLYFMDAMGIEFMPFITSKCKQYGLSIKTNICRCELPSLTRLNKDFYDSFDEKDRQKVSELDDIKHHGKESYDYQVTKTPLHLIRELEIIDEVLQKAKVLLQSSSYNRVLLVADHGATRLAVINENIINIDVNSKGTHCGRVCEYTDSITEIETATKEGEYYVLASYDRFKGGMPASVEVHGGATLEEVAVPVLQLALQKEPVHVEIKEPEKIKCSFKQAAELCIFSHTRINNVQLEINGKLFEHEPSLDQQNFKFILSGLKKGPYTASLLSDGGEIASLQFTINSMVGGNSGKMGIL